MYSVKMTTVCQKVEKKKERIFEKLGCEGEPFGRLIKSDDVTMYYNISRCSASTCLASYMGLVRMMLFFFFFFLFRSLTYKGTSW